MGQRETYYGGRCLPQIPLRVRPHPSFATSSPAPRLIAILPLLSSLNLSDYSHKYTGTTTIYNHPLVSPWLSSTKPPAAHLFLLYLVPLWVDFAFYLPVNVNKRRGERDGLYLIGCRICSYRLEWMDHRFFPSRGPLNTVSYFIFSRNAGFISALQVLTAATSASSHHRVLLRFQASIRSSGDLSSLAWRGFNCQTACATPGPFTGGDEEQTSGAVSLRPAASRPLTDVAVRCSRASCLHLKQLEPILLPSSPDFLCCSRGRGSF